MINPLGCPYCQAIISDAEKRCPICREDLNLAFLVCSHPVGDIVCLDLHNGCGATMSNSMARMRLNKVICVPLRDAYGLRIGAVYAESQRSSFISPKLCYFKPLLRIFADMAAMRIGEVLEFNKIDGQ